jgi:NAD+-dependent secondary alcohol dehydrogenase Adh1
VLVDERSLVPLPPDVEPAAVAPHADAGITAYHAVKKLLPRLLPGSTSVVIGVGGVGHIALQLLRVLGGGRVVAVDTDERRRALACELGADEVLDGTADIAGADVVLDFVASDATHAAGLAMLARGGLYSTVGYGGVVSVPSVELVVGETEIVGNLVGTWIDLWELMQLHGQGAIRLVTETHPLEAVDDVLDSLRGGDVTGRAVLVP